MPPYCKNKLIGFNAASLLFMLLVSFVSGDEVLFQWPQNYLTARLDPNGEPAKVKKFDLQVTADGFFRLKKIFNSGKQEYFSFNIKRLSDMDYLGSVTSGTLLLKTTHPDIIVQTYNDRKGNIDSMASVLTVPLKSVEPEGLDSLFVMLKKIKESKN